MINCQRQIVGPTFARLVGHNLEPGQFVEMSVTDNGTGIDPAIIDSVIVPFFTIKPIGKGSGLGLSMVEGFARQSGGGLQIESSQPGTRVSIFLPMDTTGHYAALNTKS